MYCPTCWVGSDESRCWYCYGQMKYGQIVNRGTMPNDKQSDVSRRACTHIEPEDRTELKTLEDLIDVRIRQRDLGDIDALTA